MRETVIFRDRQELQAADFTNLQAYARQTFDDLVRDAIHDGKGFAGFEVTQASSSEVTVAPGRLYADGAMFFRDTATTVQLAAQLPLVTRKKVAIVVWGLSADVDTESRDFLVDVQTGETEPQVVAMHSARAVQMQAVGGIEGPDPQPPANLDVNVLPVAYVTLSTSGVEAIEPVVGNRLPNVSEHHQLLAALTQWKELIDPRIATIVSEVADMKRQIGGVSDQRDLFQIAADMARVKEVLGLPSDYAEYGADRFLDDSESATTDPEYLAKVDEGIRFADDNAGVSPIAVFNPLDPNVKISSDLILPAWSHARRLTVSNYAGETSLSQYGYQTVEMRQLTMRRERIRYGCNYSVCTNWGWYRSGRYDPIGHIFKRAAEIFDIDADDREYYYYGQGYRWLRSRHYWRDWIEVPYWKTLVTPHSVTGASVAQTFLNAQDGWLTRVWVWFTRLAGSGNVTLAICETTENGAPNPANAIAYIAVPYGSLKIGWTAIDLPPTFLRAGKLYALRLITNADHWIGMASGNQYTHGTFFYTTDNVFYAGDLTRDMMFALDFAQFSAPRVEVQLAPLSLSGGMAAIDLMAAMVTSSVAQLSFELQVAGKWTPLSQVAPNLLVGLPPLLAFRAVFLGTKDVHAGLLAADSSVAVSRPRTGFKHISQPRLLAAPTSQVHVVLRAEAWSADHHALTCKLNTVGGLETPDTVETRDLGVDQTTGQAAIERTYAFNLAQPVSSYSIVIEGATTTALDAFHVAERVDIAF